MTFPERTIRVFLFGIAGQGCQVIVQRPAHQSFSNDGVCALLSSCPIDGGKVLDFIDPGHGFPSFYLTASITKKAERRLI